MRCALLQINAKVGDLAGNAALIAARAEEAAARGADLVLTPELALVGCPPRDLALFPALAEEAEKRVLNLARRLASGPALVLGSVGRNLAGRGRPLFNQALFLTGGRVAAAYNKRRLADYGAWDETPYFEPGDAPGLVEFQGRRLSLTIGEDIGRDGEPAPGILTPPFDLAINIAASPFAAGRPAQLQDLLSALARRHRAHFLHVNLIGGNDELIFGGRSRWVEPGGRTLARGLDFSEDLIWADLDRPEPAPTPDDLAPEAEYWRALTLGLRDFCAKLGFRGAVLGLSGGVDSALTACLAAEALGPENVTGLLMPSPYSSDHSLTDALALADNLKIKTETLPITSLMRAFEDVLPFAGLAPDTTEENLQARIRGNLLMAWANKFGKILLATGNKSEISVGYCTIYGDTCGGLAVIGDLYKTEVYRLGRWLNARRELIPPRVLTKAPSAELRPGQIDQDSLPPYEELDRILEGLLEERREAADLAAAGFSAAPRVAALVQAAEFKRRQAPPILKIAAASVFGRGGRLPIACRPPYARGPEEPNPGDLQ